MKKDHLPTNYQSGFSLVEVILASSLFILLVTTLVGSSLYGQESTMLAGNRARAALLAEEGLEAVRNIRDSGFSNTTNGTHGLAISGNQWVLSGSSDATGIFTRQIGISSVDDDRKEITSTVTWQQNTQRAGSLSLTSRLSRWMEAITLIGDWSNPTTTASVNLTGSNDGLKIASQGNYLFVIRSGGNPDFVILDVSTPGTPTQVGSLDLAGTLANIAVSGNYAYITSSDNNAELLVVNISNPATPTVAGTYNASGSTDARGIWISGTTAYVGRTNNGSTDEIMIVNVSNPSIPALLGSLNTSSDANEITVLGNYAYVASADNNQELQVVNITNPSSPSLAGSLNLSGNTDALTVDAFGSTLAIGQGSIIYVVDISTPSSPAIFGSINTGDTVNDLDLADAYNYIFVANSSNSAEFQVIDIATVSSPSLFGSLDLSGNDNLLGIVYDSINDKTYAVSNSNNQEVFIFSPQ